MQSRSRAVSAARSQNIYFEQRPAGERNQVVAYGTPGLDLFTTAGDTAWRGLLPIETTDYLYGVHRGVHYQVDNAGTLTSRGTLNSSTGRVDMAHNGTVSMIVDGTDAYTYTISTTTLAEVSDGDLISNPKTCTWLDGYFIVENGSEFQISTDGSAWDATEKATPESSPDGIVRVFADHGELTVFGEISTEFWTNTGATDFPFAPLKSSTAEWGCAAPWSVCKFNDSVAFLAKNRMGEVAPAVMQGYIPRIIQSPDFAYEINSYSTVTDATAFSYMLGGHPMYQINFPTAGKSWLYDSLTGHFSPLKSSGITRQRNEIGVNYLAKTVISDYSSGRLYRLNQGTYSENGETIERELISETISSPDRDRFPVDCFRLDMETGVGLASGQGSNPMVMLQVSRDGGQTWGSELWRSAGKIGEYGRRVEWRRLGTSDQWTFKIRFTDPCKLTLLSATINQQD
jgi:hypothetical protein